MFDIAIKNSAVFLSAALRSKSSFAHTAPMGNPHTVPSTNKKGAIPVFFDIFSISADETIVRDSTKKTKSDGTSRFTENSMASAVEKNAFCGNIAKYSNTTKGHSSKILALLFVIVFIKSPPREYIEAVMVFMKKMEKLAQALKNSRESRIFVELRGRNELVAEGFFHLSVYTDSVIEVQGGELRLKIWGQGLTMKHLGESTIGVAGRIDGVEYI